MLARSNWARKSGTVLSYLGMVSGGLGTLYYAWAAFIQSEPNTMLPLVSSLIASIMSGMTLWAINNTEGR
jgi:hypothetical protein